MTGGTIHAGAAINCVSEDLNLHFVSSGYHVNINPFSHLVDSETLAIMNTYNQIAHCALKP
jgi:hypothetical protein